MTVGWTKPPAFEPDPPIPVPAQTDATRGWVTVATFDGIEQIGDGPGLLMGHLGLDLGVEDAATGKLSKIPTDIRTRWMRGSGDPTGYQTHYPGTIRPWAAGVPYGEDISPGDLPLRFQVWQKGGVAVIRKGVCSIFVPTQYAAAKLRLVVP